MVEGQKEIIEDMMKMKDVKRTDENDEILKA